MAAKKTETESPEEPKVEEPKEKKITKADVLAYAKDHKLSVEFGHEYDKPRGIKVSDWWCVKQPRLKLWQFIGVTDAEALKWLTLFIAGLERAKKGDWKKYTNNV